MREFTIEEKGAIVTCWTKDKPQFGFRFDKTNRMAQYCLTIIHDGYLDTKAKMDYMNEVTNEFIAFARVQFPTLFYEPKPRCGVEEVQLR